MVFCVSYNSVGIRLEMLLVMPEDQGLSFGFC